MAQGASFISQASICWIFGFRGDVKGNGVYVDAQNLLYLAGGTMVTLNNDQNLQRFYPLALDKGKSVTAVAVDQKRNLLAVGEKGLEAKDEKPSVSVYELDGMRKKRTFGPLDQESHVISCLEISQDTKFVLVLGGDPDYVLFYYQWEKAMCLGSTKLINPSPGVTSIQASFKPEDSRVVAVTGLKTYQHYRLMDGALKPVFQGRVERHDCMCHTWISGKTLIIGTGSGLLMIYEGAELRKQINVWEKEKEGSESLTSTRTNSLASIPITPAPGAAPESSPELAITAVAAYSKGLVCACLGVVMLLEKVPTKDFYKNPRSIEIPKDPYSTLLLKSGQVVINNIIVSPTEEHILCTTECGLIFEYHAPANAMKDELGTLGLVQCRPHQGVVLDVDICFRKPLAVTCGVDRYIRIWNMESRKLEVYKQFPDDPISVSFHPTGLFVLVSFANNVCFLNVLIDDLTVAKEIQLRQCREVSFSKGGHYFSLIYGNLIQTFSTTTFELVSVYRGHDGKISRVVWSGDDTRLVSVGLDGAVYEWEVVGAKRLGENVIKGVGYLDVALSPDGKQLFALGNDRIIKEMLDSQINRLVDCKEVLTCLYVSPSGRTMFAGTSGGSIRSFKFPLSLPFTWTEFPAHSGPVTRLKISHDDQYLTSISEDGTVVVWLLTDPRGEPLSREKKLTYTNEILIGKADLIEKNEQVVELRTRVTELVTENQYQLRMRDLTYNAKIKELADSLLREIDNLKSTNKSITSDKDQSERIHRENIEEIEARHAQALTDLDLSNRKKLVLEYEMYHDLEQRSQALQADYERQLRVLQQTMDTSLEQQAESYELKLSDAHRHIDKLKTGLSDLARQKELELRQVELDVDEEIQVLKMRYEKILEEEKQKYDDLKLEVLAMKKKDTRIAMLIEDQKETIKKHLFEIRKLTQSCRLLREEKKQMRKEKEEKDEIIQNKEKRIYELRMMNQDLEKFRYVMDHKISELKEQLERKEERMKCMREEIEEMQKDLLMFQGQFDKWERDSVGWKMKFIANENESSKDKQSASASKTLLQRIKVDLHMCVGLIQQEKKFKESFTTLYHKYVTLADLSTFAFNQQSEKKFKETFTSLNHKHVTLDDLRGEVKFDKDVETEFIEQKEHLERTVGDQAYKLSREIREHTVDNFKIMQENGLMHVALNELRRELARERTKVTELINAMGLFRRSGGNTESVDLLRQLANQTKNAELGRQLKEAHRALEAQRHLAGTLRRTVCQLEYKVQEFEEAAEAAERYQGAEGGNVGKSPMDRGDWTDEPPEQEEQDQVTQH